MQGSKVVSAKQQVIYIYEQIYNPLLYTTTLFRSEVVRHSKANQLRVAHGFKEFQIESIRRPDLEACFYPMQILKEKCSKLLFKNRPVNFLIRQEIQNILQNTTDTAIQQRKKEIARRDKDREHRKREIQKLYAEENKNEKTKTEPMKATQTKSSQILGYKSMPYWIILEGGIVLILLLFAFYNFS